MFKSIKSQLQRFTACTNGNVTIMMGLSAIPIFVAAGSAIDYGRYTNTHHDVGMALDAGMLAAAAKLYNDDDVTETDTAVAFEIGQKYFKEALGTQNGASISDPVFVYNADAQLIEASVAGEVHTSFMVVVGKTNMDVSVSAKTKVGYEEVIGSDVEVALMLDVTGSMCNFVDGSFAQPCSSSTSLDALKEAAEDLIDNVIWDDQSKYKSKVSIVPFSSHVRLGADGASSALFEGVTNLPATWTGHVSRAEIRGTLTTQGTCEAQPNHRWQRRGRWGGDCYETVTNLETHKVKPCVTERFTRLSGAAATTQAAFGLTENAPGTGRYNNGMAGTREPVAIDSSNAAGRSFSSSSSSPISYQNTPQNYSLDGSCTGSAAVTASNIVMPLTNDVASLKARITGLAAEGGTGGALGTSFAWYTLSPQWASVWGADSAPQPYSKLTELNENGKPKLFKIAVLMTDGEYNSSRAAETYIDNEDGSDPSVQNPRAIALCDSMEAQGIEIYTVGFNLSDGSTSKAMLQSCAKDADHFKDAASTADLKKAFKDIGKRIKSQAAMEIRLTQ